MPLKPSITTSALFTGAALLTPNLALPISSNATSSTATSESSSPLNNRPSFTKLDQCYCSCWGGNVDETLKHCITRCMNLEEHKDLSQQGAHDTYTSSFLPVPPIPTPESMPPILAVPLYTGGPRPDGTAEDCEEGPCREKRDNTNNMDINIDDVNVDIESIPDGTCNSLPTSTPTPNLERCTAMCAMPRSNICSGPNETVESYMRLCLQRPDH